MASLIVYNDIMSTTKAKQKAVARYNARSYERITVRIRKEDIEDIKDAVGDRSMNGFVCDAIREKIERERRPEKK